LSNKDKATREALASELGQLKDKYSQLEQAFNELKSHSSQNQAQGLVQPQGQPNDTFYQEANMEVDVTSE